MNGGSVAARAVAGNEDFRTLPLSSRDGATRLAPFAVCAILTLLAAALRLYHLGDLPVWRDETIVYWLGDESLARIWSRDLALTGTHPPLFYTIHYFWNHLLAWLAITPTEVTVRLPSVIIGVLTIPVFYGVLGCCFGDRVAAIGAAYLAFSPTFVEFSRTAKSEVLVVFLLVLTMGFAVRLLTRLDRIASYKPAERSTRHQNVMARLDRAISGNTMNRVMARSSRAMTSGTAVYQSFHRSVSGRDSTIAEVLQPRFLALAAGYVLSAVALLHAHSVGFMGLFIPSILFATWFVNGRWRFSAVIVWSVLNLMVVAVFIPWLALLAEIASANTGYFWLKPIGVRNALAIFSHVLLDKHYPGSIETGTPIALTLSEMTLAASLVIAGCARAMHGDWRRRGIVIAFVLLPVIFFAVSQVKPVFWEYILMSFALPLLALLAGFALEAPVLGRVGQAAMIAGLMLFQLPAERVVYAGEPEPWNDVAAYLASNTAAGEPILFWPPHAEWSVRFYWKSDISRWRTVNLGPHLEFAPLRTVPSLPVTAVPEFVHDAERVWLVTDEKAVPSDDDLPALRTTLLKRLHLVTRQNFEGGLTVFGYANRRRD